MKITFKNKLAVAACTGLLALGTFSCQKDLLEPAPETLIAEEFIFDSPTRILAQVNGLYSFVKAGAFYGSRFVVYGNIRGEDFINETGNLVTGAAVWNNTLTDNSQNDVVNLWSAAYQAINQCNVFLAGMDANEAKFAATPFPATFAATTANQYRAEARFLRALSYYSLLQFYARPYIDGNGSRPGLPLRLTPQTTLAGNDLARSTVGEVYDQILADLNFAEQNLPLTYAGATLNVTRAHRNTAIALKTRVYLSMARYANVITEANKIVSATAPFTATSGVPHALAASIASVFNPPQENTESILSFPFTAQNQPGTQNQLGFYFLPGAGGGGNGEYSLNPNGILASPAFAANDVRRTSFVRLVGATNKPFLTKYPTGAPAPYTDKSPVIRYAEVLLNLSEALARTNSDLPRSVALLNAVRGRSNGSLYPATIGQQDLINAILTERRIEFLGEGIRIFDIMRLNQPIPAKPNVSAVPPSDQRYIWPIPATERQTNALICPGGNCGG